MKEYPFLKVPKVAPSPNTIDNPIFLAIAFIIVSPGVLGGKDMLIMLSLMATCPSLKSNFVIISNPLILEYACITFPINNFVTPPLPS